MGKYDDEVKRAVIAFKSNVEKIHTVKEWADYMKFDSTKVFSRHIKIHFRKPAIKVMTELRIQEVIKLMLKFPDKSFFCIARSVGLQDEKSLYDYVKYHTKLSPTALKNKVEKSKLQSII